MLTPEQERFVKYWEEQRLRKKDFLRKFSIGLPVMVLLATLFFANFISGWYSRANAELKQHSSLVIVILFAVVIIVLFVVIFSARHKWDRSEADYQSLLKKRSGMQ